MKMPGAFLFALAAACSPSSPKQAPPSSQPQDAPSAAAPKSPGIDDRYDPGALGALTFEISEGTPEARAHFTRGLLALHSFWYDEAERQFDAAMRADPRMNMPYWGAAMSKLKLLWGEDDLGAARFILSQMPDPEQLSPRLQAWVLSTVELIKAPDVRTSRRQYAAALERLHAQYPDDESASFLAIALLATTRPEDPDTIAVRKRAAGLALEVFQRNPKHPGAAHYLIHAYDTPELASLALPHARSYAKLAPAAFHARHMPAHIFSRLGMWSDAIASCQSAWDASVAAARHAKLSANHHDFHSLQWLIEMNFEIGHGRDASAALTKFATAVRGGLGRQHRAAYVTEVESYLMRTGEWSRLDELLAALDEPVVEEPAPPSAPARPSGRAGEPATHCAPLPASSPLELLERLAVLQARARAAAMQRDVAATKRHLDGLDALRAELRPYLVQTQSEPVVRTLDAAQVRQRKLLLAHATNDDRAVLAALRESVSDQPAQATLESNPSGFIVREQVADALLRLSQFRAAAAEYARVLEQHPNRAHSILGAARASERVGDSGGARKFHAQLLELWATADDDTPGLAEVRAALSAAQKK